MAAENGARRRPARPREEVLAESMAAIAEQGLSGLTMAALGRRLGMSGGHLLYYFGSKDRLLLETLQWSEGQLGERRREIAGADPSTAGGLAEYAALYLPDRAGDPRWVLWLEVWNRSSGSEALRAGAREIGEAWHRDLVGLLRQGAAEGGFRASPPPDPDGWSARYAALLDGLAVPVVTGLPGASRDAALAHAAAHVRDTLSASSG
jgi:AcrR family transcriptional regulator